MPMPTTVSPFWRRIPMTPGDGRPIGGASEAWNAVPVPVRVDRITRSSFTPPAAHARSAALRRAPAVLRAVCRERHPLGVVAARERDDDILVGDQLLVGELSGHVVTDLRAAVVTKALAEPVEVGLDEREDLSRIREDRLELCDEL